MKDNSLSKDLWRKLFIIMISSLFIGAFLVVSYNNSKQTEIIQRLIIHNVKLLADNISFATKIRDSLDIKKTINLFYPLLNIKYSRVKTNNGFVLFTSGSPECNSTDLLTSNIVYISKKVGTLEICTQKNFHTNKVDFKILLIFLGFFIIIFFIGIYVIKVNTNPIYEFIQEVEKINFSNLSFPEKPKKLSNNQIIDELFIKMHSIIKDLESTKNALISQREAEERVKISKQVAHDIKSPLAALEVVMEDLKSLPEDTRQITLHAVARIQEIANNLSKSKISEVEDSGNDKALISISLSNIINEKKIEYRDADNLKISFIDLTDKMNFTSINDSVFQRIISNLINNSFEALSGKGKIAVSFDEVDGLLVLKISDDGPGFPKAILQEGISRGKSINKKDGQGLGLNYAKEEIGKANGELTIRNYNGAIVEIKLSKSEEPKWFQGHIDLKGVKNIVILDDDSSIHELWNKKLSGLKLNIEHFNTIDELKKFDYDLFLIDHDLRDDKTGLDLILEHNLENALLVTSNYDDSEVIKACELNGIKILPKQLVPYINFFEKITP